MIKLLIADDHGIVRSALRCVLRNIRDIQIIGEAKTGEEAVGLAQQLNPDLVLMDICMPKTDGLSASLHLLQHAFSSKILVISAQEKSIIPLHLLKQGACGYISKQAHPETLVKAIRAICTGGYYFDYAWHHAGRYQLSASPFLILSSRELQIAFMVVCGMKSKEIANRIFLSCKTVQGYHRGLMKKLGIIKDVELVQLAVRHHLLDLDSM